MNLKPVTPLRRSERIRRPTVKAIGSSPGSSPGAATYPGPTIGSRSRVFSAPGNQTDSDSTLWNSTSSKSSGSCTEDTVGDAPNSMALTANLPRILSEPHERVAPILGLSNAELMKRDIPSLHAYLNEINAFLQKVIGIGFSCKWPGFNDFVGLYGRIASVIDAKRATLSSKQRMKLEEIDFMGMGKGLEFAVGPDWVAMKGEHWQEENTANTDYLQRMYRNAAPPSNFGWDDVGAGGSEVQSHETDALDYSLSYPYPQARTLDYCTIPDTY